MEAAGLGEAQRAALRAFCDTVVPSIDRPSDPDGFWARKTTDLAVDDGSPFPTASGTNPMITIMALARRTAFAIADAAGKPASDQQTTGVVS